MAEPAVFDPLSVDSVTIGIAIIASVVVGVVRWKRGLAPAITRRRLINDFLNGSVIYPFLLLVVSVPDSTVFAYLRDSRIALGLAGCVGLIFVVGELIASGSPEKPHES
jgi:hypothetical protein